MARIPIPSAFGAMLAVAALYLAKPVLAPLAIALLLSAVFEPVVRRLEPIGRGRMRLGRVGSVLVVVVAISAALGLLGLVVASQASDIAGELPKYGERIRTKLEEPLARAERALRRMDDITSGGDEPATKVELVERQSELARVLGDWSGSVLGALGNAGIVVVLLVFILIERDELRERVLRVAGRGDLRLTSGTVREATERVTRYLRALALLNCGHGLVVGTGLALLGLPAAPLFGLLSALLRFVPYVGPWVAALAPVALALAALEGWTFALGIALFLATVELVSNNFVEPWLYGASVGLSPFAVILSAIFWTWLWGPTGLVLATPLTVCLVVVGRHVPQLENLSILLGNSRALRPHERMYERIGARDSEAAAEVFLSEAEAKGALAAWDEIAVPTLRLLERDRARQQLGEDDLAAAREVFTLLLEGLPERATPPPEAAARAIVCVPAAAGADEILAAALAHELTARGFSARATARLLTAELVEDVTRERAPLICISVIDPRGMPVRHLLKRLRHRCPDALLVLGCWGAAQDRLPALRRQWGEPLPLELVTTLAEAADLLASRARLDHHSGGASARAS
ncbi:MAG TPA: AI-2E family transporter [Myxococcota bacterium]|nr:AI-2E family transporter [Myxococcota bacterium]